MPPRRALRFTVEALFLALLAAALAVADLEPLVIAGAMLAGWLVVALFEWAAARERPHYGRGLPPRYYVPQVSLPPPRPLEQLRTGYQGADDDTPTWFASPDVRAEAPPGWPVGAAVGSRSEDTIVDERFTAGFEGERRADGWLDVDDASETVHVGPPPQDAALEDAAPDVDLDHDEVGEAADGADEDMADGGDLAWDDAALDDEEVAAAAVAAAGARQEAARERAVGDSEGATSTPGHSERHQFDPFEEAPPARRGRRRKGVVDVAYVEVSAGPPRPRALPGQSRRLRDELPEET